MCTGQQVGGRRGTGPGCQAAGGAGPATAGRRQPGAAGPLTSSSRPGPTTMARFRQAATASEAALASASGSLDASGARLPPLASSSFSMARHCGGCQRDPAWRLGVVSASPAARFQRPAAPAPEPAGQQGTGPSHVLQHCGCPLVQLVGADGGRCGDYLVQRLHHSLQAGGRRQAAVVRRFVSDWKRWRCQASAASLRTQPQQQHPLRTSAAWSSAAEAIISMSRAPRTSELGSFTESRDMAALAKVRLAPRSGPARASMVSLQTPTSALYALYSRQRGREQRKLGGWTGQQAGRRGWVRGSLLASLQPPSYPPTWAAGGTWPAGASLESRVASAPCSASPPSCAARQGKAGRQGGELGCE